MNADLSKAYELLGVKPGVSPRDLKAAHRDLAKVWHPDRFLHDPRLQEKAQEKLKEINEAYELLSMGPRPAPSRPVSSEPKTPVTRRRSSSLQWALLPLLLCLVVFAITTKVLQQRARSASQQQQVEQPATAPQETAAQTERDSRTRVVGTSQKTAPAGAAPELAATEITSSQPTPAVATVTVMIDPESGLLAKRDCPVRSRMTYPSGSEPTGYCNLNHAPPPKDSRIKSIAKSVGRAID